MALIAIIDDDPDILDASTLVLESKGYEVVTASNPKDGYAIVFKHNPDLIILDVMMDEPDDGFFLAQKFRREKIQTPIIMYTSVSKTIGMDYGASEMVPVDDFVEKPITPDELIRKVEKLLVNQVKE
ncbi:MAG: response regulator [Ignavibacteria bacterium]|jgi:DNA-binding response OmpR family regulator|nr:response regulator [Ignavibacteria bacterium]MCU7503852.1 response regulator [Ignavibacteria bacterium]MCU7515927.1 response regulator [Ignavibacteria bacterium]